MRSGMCENGVCRWRKNQSGYTVHAEKRGVCGGEAVKVLIACEESQTVCKTVPGIAKAMAEQWG